jgi:hypothetical protein
MLSAARAGEDHPRLYVSDADKPAIQAKIRDHAWAAGAYRNLLATIDPYVTRHQSDPQWIVSRLAMYWKPGERYTQCYIKDENWDRGTGDAPVPTVRLPGMRTWNDYQNAPLEDRIPYSENGDMKALSRKNPDQPPVIVPYKKSGHLVRSNNVEILSLAEKAAFAYWVSGEEKYAKFAADIFNAWLVGTYYMKPVLDPGKSSKGPGGTKPGGILGYHDYEQIHDDLALHAAPVYDFLFDYLQAHPAPALQATGKSLPEVAGIVFKRFVDIGRVRGGHNGNWNVNGWNMMMLPMLVLEKSDAYADGHGRDYYLPFFTTNSTKYHDALPKIVAAYDKDTGLWPESPGYAFGTINTLLQFDHPISRQGVDIIRENPALQKAALAVFPWMDARGNLVVFGDMRGGPANFSTFENLLAYYTRTKDEANARAAAAAIRQGVEAGIYDRSKVDWTGICVNVGDVSGSGATPAARTAYSAFHRHVVLRNGNDPKTALMATLYGGRKGAHLSENGLAMQLYGMGWALGPDASAYESYWSDDRAYHQSAVGSNTILPGYTRGPITVHTIDPPPARGGFTNTTETSPWCSFADIGADEKRRLVAIVRTSSTTGYYVDIFRSKLPDNDYLYHNVGSALRLADAANRPLAEEPAAFGKKDPALYRFFRNVSRTHADGDFLAQWTIPGKSSPTLSMDMWMRGGAGRSVFQFDAPPTTLVDVTPAGASKAPASTPSIIVRQTGKDGWNAPFVAVFEPYEDGRKSVAKITALPGSRSFVGLVVESRPLDRELQGRKDVILNAVDDAEHATPDGGLFQGTFAVASTNAEGLRELYLGRGKRLRVGRQELASAGSKPVSASISNAGGAWSYSADAPIRWTFPRAKAGTPLPIVCEVRGKRTSVTPVANSREGTATVELPAGDRVTLHLPAD